MGETERNDLIIGSDDLILVTGASGFIGYRLVQCLLERGFRNLRCFVRPTSAVSKIEALRDRFSASARVEVVKGNLFSPAHCGAAMKDVKVIFHLAVGRGTKSFPDAFMNAVVTTRNLLDATLEHRCLRRFVSVSSLAVYTNAHGGRRRLLDETSPVENRPELRGDAYCFAKVKQDEIVVEYGNHSRIPYVIVRPGYVIGPGKTGITNRVGIDTFGVFLHLGGRNALPLTYVDNCADAIMMAGLKEGVDGEVFNIVDDDLPSSRSVLRQYKKHVKRFTSFYVPHAVSYSLCYLWERYSAWSEGQLPPVYNRKQWRAVWRKARYSNNKLKTRVGWTPRVPMEEGLRRYFEACRNGAFGA